MFLRRMLLILLAATLLALYVNAQWMTRTLRIDARTYGERAEAVDDRAEGGRSEARLLRDAQSLRLLCDIRPGYEWPFCDLQISLTAPDQGLDLSRFETLRLWLKASGPEERVQVRVFLRNYDPAYASSGHVADLKPHELVLEPAAEPQPVDIRLGQFAVASWWMQSHPLPLASSGPQLERISLLSFTTGGVVKPGLHEVELVAAEFRGPWVSTASFRLAIIAVWMVAIAGYLLWEWRKARRSLRKALRSKQDLHRLNQRLTARSSEYEAMAHQDALTGLANRRGLEHDLRLLQQSQEELLYPLSIVFMDIDHFKRVNDEQGHDVGDAVLQTMAAELRSHVQREDLLARWGGEEFVLMMPQTTAEEAMSVAERLQLCLSQARWPGALQVTASFGVAQCDCAASMETALRAADQAMYEAKQQGRDRVVRAA